MSGQPSAIKRCDILQVREGFNPNSYTESNPPPLYCREDGIPPCAFGYIRSLNWLDEYATRHKLITEKDGFAWGAERAIVHIMQALGQPKRLKRVDNNGYRLIFYVGSTLNEEDLKKALDPQNIKLLRKVLEIPDDDQEPPRWLRPKGYLIH